MINIDLGSWTIVEEIKENRRKYVILECSCADKTRTKKRADYLKDPRFKKHCGCKDTNTIASIKPGNKYGRCLVLELPYRTETSCYVKIQCDCGTIKDVWPYGLINGETTSCGCYNLEKLSERKGEGHPLYSHGMSNTPEHNLWSSRKEEMCDEWQDFMTFYAWYSVNRTDKTAMVKIDSSLPLSPTNVQFLTHSQYSQTNVEKAQQTNLKKYGVKSPIQLEEFVVKRKENNLEKYGVESVMQLPEFQEKVKTTSLEKYGVPHPLMSEEVKNKKYATNLKKYGTIHPSQTKEVKDKIIASKRKNGTAYDIDGKSAAEIAEEMQIAHSTLVKWIKKYGLEAALEMDVSYSEIENAVASILTNNNIEFQQQFRTNNKIADFLIPSHNIIVECDGLYWHSDLIIKDKKYHKIKRESYIAEGYTPLFFREDEIVNSPSVIESIILNKMGLNKNRVFARKCSVVHEAGGFFEENHLMGAGAGKCIFLSYNDEIVAGIRYFKRKGYNEISRFCCKKNTTVVGGLTKLISKIPKPISTFIDLRYGDPQHLINLGFEQINADLSFKWVYGNKSFHRSTHGGNTGYEHKCYKIWDCGQAKLVLK